jgi:hypothetical protein
MTRLPTWGMCSSLQSLWVLDGRGLIPPFDSDIDAPDGDVKVRTVSKMCHVSG